ncbi:hypothetical protein LTR78_009500 [Recurvomyces mirabilis]|uniref:DUF7371 domain-containing protein n=1 Tax=Recurvomyces mirabilis TaxID=574656 RepID=A0AAE0TN76_9PEZI|nr:hypothetical protein LTR78_009500 [Recurvomyces mirabilis]KAK5152404.1 hypothetical protein LTS14_008351 [Recurvomyces mirabilis]
MSAILEQAPHRRNTNTIYRGFDTGLRLRGRHRPSHTTGGHSEPGRVITKAERQKRLAESKSPSPETAAGPISSFAETGNKILAWLGKLTASDEGNARPVRETTQDLEDNTASHAALTALYHPGGSPGRQPVRLRGFIIFVILFLLVISPLYYLAEYFINGTSVEAACIPTTIYVPVTQISTITSTFSAFQPSLSTSDSNVAITTTSYSTIHSTSTMYRTVTVTTVPPGYPTASYVMTVTQTQTVSPMSTAPTIVSTESAAASTPTVTAPAYTSTTFSFVNAPITITSTSTFYSTVQVSYAPSIHPSYGGYGPSGWNTSSQAIVGPTVGSTAPASASEVVSTITATYYLGTDSSTTQTGTIHITTILTVHGTSTVTLSSFSTSFPYTPSPTTISSSSSTSRYASVASSSLSSVSAAPGSGTATFPLFTISTSSSNASTSASTYAPAPNTISSYGIGTAPLPALSSRTSSFSSANMTLNSESSSTTSTTLSSLVPGNTSTTQPSQLSSTTAAIVVPITTTLSFGSLTTFLKSTSTTIGLLGTSTQTVSSYFVWNGTTTYTSGQPATLTSKLPIVSTSGSANTTTSISSVHSTSTPSSTASGPITSGATPPSLSIPVSDSTGALSAISSELSGLTTSTQSSQATGTKSIGSTSSHPSSTTPSTSSTSMTTTSSTITSSASSTSRLAPSSSSAGLISTISAPTLSAYGSSSTIPSVSAASSVTSPPSISSSSTSSIATSTSTSSSSSSSSMTSTLQSTPQGHSQPAAVSSTTTQSSTSNNFPPSSASATPTACGESGPFTMTFDDLPSFTPNNLNQTDITQAPPMPNPYHHLKFSNGYVYAPLPNEPYLPASSPHLAVFLANGSGMRTGPGAGSENPGEIADGPYQSMSAFWFDAFSSFVGCDNSGPSDCTMVLTGYTWSPEAGREIPAYTQNMTVAPCPSLQGCVMQLINFPESFRGLSGLQMRAYVGQQERMFFVDNLALAWSNDTCAAGLERLRHQ